MSQKYKSILIKEQEEGTEGERNKIKKTTLKIQKKRENFSFFQMKPQLKIENQSSLSEKEELILLLSLQSKEKEEKKQEISMKISRITKIKSIFPLIDDVSLGLNELIPILNYKKYKQNMVFQLYNKKYEINSIIINGSIKEITPILINIELSIKEYVYYLYYIYSNSHFSLFSKVIDLEKNKKNIKLTIETFVSLYKKYFLNENEYKSKEVNLNHNQITLKSKFSFKKTLHNSNSIDNININPSLLFKQQSTLSSSKYTSQQNQYSLFLSSLVNDFMKKSFDSDENHYFISINDYIQSINKSISESESEFDSTSKFKFEIYIFESRTTLTNGDLIGRFNNKDCLSYKSESTYIVESEYLEVLSMSMKQYKTVYDKLYDKMNRKYISIIKESRIFVNMSKSDIIKLLLLSNCVKKDFKKNIEFCWIGKNNVVNDEIDVVDLDKSFVIVMNGLFSVSIYDSHENIPYLISVLNKEKNESESNSNINDLKHKSFKQQSLYYNYMSTTIQLGSESKLKSYQRHQLEILDRNEIIGIDEDFLYSLSLRRGLFISKTKKNCKSNLKSKSYIKRLRLLIKSKSYTSSLLIINKEKFIDDLSRMSIYEETYYQIEKYLNDKKIIISNQLQKIFNIKNDQLVTNGNRSISLNNNSNIRYNPIYNNIPTLNIKNMKVLVHNKVNINSRKYSIDNEKLTSINNSECPSLCLNNYKDKSNPTVLQKNKKKKENLKGDLKDVIDYLNRRSLNYSSLIKKRSYHSISIRFNTITNGNL